MVETHEEVLEDVEEKVTDLEEENVADDADTDDTDNTADTNDDDSAGDDASDSDNNADDADRDADSDDTGEDQSANEITALRQMVRAQRQQLKSLEGKLGKHTKALVDKDIVTEDELSDEDNAVNAQRQVVLDQMVELMELNPKFADVKSVCSQGNFDDVAEILANAYVAENGGDADEVADAIVANIWSKTNPYKEMYELVRKYHPRYADANAGAQEKTATPSKKKGAPSLSDMPAGDTNNTAGWTSARIDKLDEDDLSKVPAAVYEKYMMGELD